MVPFFATTNFLKKDEKEPRGSSSSFALNEKNQETMTSLPPRCCCRLLQLKEMQKMTMSLFCNWSKTTKDNDEPRSRFVIIFCIWGKKPRDNDKLGGSLSFSTPKKNQEMMMSREPPNLSSSSIVEEKNQEMMTS